MKTNKQESPLEKSNEANEKKTWISPTIEHWEHFHIEFATGGGSDAGHIAYL